jgi:crotonobetainyl-CoA:carnitine CoA-transferase CaiB-like acyl-CoA transferase
VFVPFAVRAACAAYSIAAMNQTPNRKALSHIRVLDLSRVLAGPWATQNLADLGAEVIKVERPGAGDDTRGWGPPFVRAGEAGGRGDSAYFLSANRGKESVTIDMATPQGQALVRALAQRSDIVVENYKVGTLAKYGLDYASLRELNPRLIYCSVTGFGQSGPYAPRPGYDFVFQGMGGLMSITGVPDGEPGAGPMKVGVAVADLMTGMYATTAILAALEHRHSSGEGQYIDIALLDCLVALTSFQTLNYFVSGQVPQRLGNGHPNIVPYQVFACKGGHIILAVANDGQFRSFCQAAGKPEWADDERFKVGASRGANRALICGMVGELMLQRTMHEWIELLEANNVPCGPINHIDEVFEDPQVQHRGMRVDVQHPSGPLSLLASPMRLADTPVTYTVPPPLLGQHTDDVLRRVLALSDDELRALREQGVV